uniref:Uncharacterized protein n=1 Tax=Plectus sambesii TaxID=2011161 RepID=A0A914X3S3_9BILA
MSSERWLLGWLMSQSPPDVACRRRKSIEEMGIRRERRCHASTARWSLADRVELTAAEAAKVEYRPRTRSTRQQKSRADVARSCPPTALGLANLRRSQDLADTARAAAAAGRANLPPFIRPPRHHSCHCA